MLHAINDFISERQFALLSEVAISIILLQTFRLKLVWNLKIVAIANFWKSHSFRSKRLGWWDCYVKRKWKKLGITIVNTFTQKSRFFLRSSYCKRHPLLRFNFPEIALSFIFTFFSFSVQFEDTLYIISALGWRHAFKVSPSFQTCSIYSFDVSCFDFVHRSLLSLLIIIRLFWILKFSRQYSLCETLIEFSFLYGARLWAYY